MAEAGIEVPAFSISAIVITMWVVFVWANKNPLINKEMIEQKILIDFIICCFSSDIIMYLKELLLIIYRSYINYDR